MKNIAIFLKEVKAELSRIIWPTKKEFIGSTMVVLLVILAFALFLSAVNYMLYTGAQKVLLLAFGR